MTTSPPALSFDSDLSSTIVLILRPFSDTSNFDSTFWGCSYDSPLVRMVLV